VRISLEIVNRYEANWGRSIAEGLEFLAAVAHPNLGLTPDTFHMNIEEADLGEAIRRGGAHILHMHVADSNRQAPGSGHFDFPQVLSALREVGYAGCFSIELFENWHGIRLQPSPEEALGRGRAALERRLEEVFG
jgi:sugar phosphate isomerase/epimerase